jgi:hypothetical protein
MTECNMNLYVYVVLIIVVSGVQEQFIQLIRHRLLKISRHCEDIDLDERL